MDRVAITIADKLPGSIPYTKTVLQFHEFRGKPTCLEVWIIFITFEPDANSFETGALAEEINGRMNQVYYSLALVHE
jgi:hypothetical protein